MKSPVKKVAAIHDLSGIGRSALNSIIPILSSTGIQVCPFPTAILSSETAFYDHFTFVVISSLLNGDSLPIALDKAMQLMNIAIKESIGYEYYKGEGEDKLYYPSKESIEAINKLIIDNSL